VEEWFGQQLPCTKIPSQIAIVAAVGRAWLFARRTVTLYASAVLGGGFAVTSLFLACGVSGCGGKKVNGLELFKVRTPASWYLNELMDPPWKQIGQGIYVLGIFLATAALISLFVSFIRKSWLTQVFSNSVYAYLVLFSALFLFYELAWGDIVLTIWPLYSLALCLCLVLASRRARRRIAGWSSRIDGKNTRMYSAGFVFYTSLLAAYGAATLARDRFWGVLAFATGQFLLFRCVHIARAEKAQESPPPKSIRQPLPTAPHP
jgi:hypothetical protein